MVLSGSDSDSPRTLDKCDAVVRTTTITTTTTTTITGLDSTTDGISAMENDPDTASHHRDHSDDEIACFPKPEIMRHGPVSALVNFIYDMEDSSEGIRIWGSDPYSPENWEVGQVIYQRWWFLFDRQVVDRSNYLRSLRGAGDLRVQ